MRFATLLVAAMVFVAGAAHAGTAAPTDRMPTVLKSPEEKDWPQGTSIAAVGRAKVECTVSTEGVPGDCKVLEEEPEGLGFGAAAIKYAMDYRFSPAMKDGQPVAGPFVIDVPFGPPIRMLEGGLPDTRPIFLTTPDEASRSTVWPKDVLSEGIGGAATLRCVVTTEGFLSDCRAAGESPAGKGFGAAALMLAPSFRMKPAMKDGRPVAVEMDIPICFRPGGGVWGGGRSVAVLTWVPWTSVPKASDLAAAYPEDALADTDYGHVLLRCRVKEDGTLGRCIRVEEEPKAKGFSRAAESLTPLFHARAGDDLKDGKPTYVNLAVHFINPKRAATEVPAIRAPDWTRLPDPQKALSLFPPQAAKAGIKSGKGMVKCTVMADGHLSNCKAIREDPAALGFGEAAVSLASALTINPWTRDGRPVEGAEITLPLKFVLDEAPTDAAPAR